MPIRIIEILAAKTLPSQVRFSFASNPFLLRFGTIGSWDLQRTCLGVTTEEDIKYKLPNTVFL